MDDSIKQNLEKVAAHWEASSKRLWKHSDTDTDESLKACDETAAIVLKDCASELRRVLAGDEPLVDKSPEEILLAAILAAKE